MTESTLEYIPIDWSQVAASNWIYQARMDFGETLDLSDSSIEFRVSIPDSYVTDATLELQVVVHAEDSANTDYGTHIVLSSLTKTMMAITSSVATLTWLRLSGSAFRFPRHLLTQILKIPFISEVC